MGSGLSPGPIGGSFVSALCVHNGDLIAAGKFAVAGSVPAANIARWNGTAWSALGSGLSGNEDISFRGPADALASHASALFAGGVFTQAGGSPSPSFAIWGPTAPLCYPNCDCSVTSPVLSISDFICFVTRFAASDPYANCDASTAPPTLNVADFICFMNKFAAGCS